MKKVSAIAAALSIFAFAGAAFAGGAFSPGDLKASADSKVGVKAANTVYFGNYWITSANTGSPKEAIAWKLVSAKSKDKDGKWAFLLFFEIGFKDTLWKKETKGIRALCARSGRRPDKGIGQSGADRRLCSK